MGNTDLLHYQVTGVGPDPLGPVEEVDLRLKDLVMHEFIPDPNGIRMKII